ncbi:hypothetical protein [Paracnuella aquatica]|uniref:hypothetical protein n=1 Tax=Paracnuella aquatica TaxID=2268757 RepID=UPI000DEFEC48|nr:hypothetical protein [Paracnuella aquatica]RPD51461.1 hypothetical protein DRJ53_01915 [Paracnuella aquatica]
MKKILFLFVVAVWASGASAQAPSADALKALQAKEDTLKNLAKSLIVDSLIAGRMRNDSLFVRTLIRSLQIKNSFYYPFDSVRGIGNVYAPDSTFRIFSWTLSLDDFYSRQRGAIQFRTADGSLKLVPLHDFSEFTERPLDSVRTNATWIGAVYYNIVKTEHNGKPYYTLFGFDDNSVRSNKKWIEVLHFNNQGQPVFGGPFFTFQGDSLKRKPQHRFSIEYKKEASALVNYDSDLKVILVDHLVSETEEDDKPYTFIPDGDYEGFKWDKGKWVYINKVFDQKLEDGQAPVPDPLLDDLGNRNEQKLKTSTEKNKTKKKGN